MDFIQILSIFLAPISAAAGWLAGRRKRNNDFITDLQNSIDLLSDKYTKTLNELVAVKEQNMKLQIEISEVKSRNATLTSKVDNLLKKLKAEK